MNDEIKEIFNDTKEFIKDLDDKSIYGIPIGELRQLLDYITNLQQIEQEHKKINGELREENSKLEIALENIQEDYDRRIKEIDVLKKKLDRRTEENERLKEDLKGQENLTLSYCKSEQDYKSRCEKVNLVIKGIFYGGNEDYYLNKIKEIQNILQNGSDKE